jgi:hypothetical protein
MKKITSWFTRPIKLNNREQYVFKIIELMLNNEQSEVRIDPDNMDYYINNKAKHYDVIIGETYIIMTNSLTMVKEDYRSDFLEHCKGIAKIRATKDRLKIKDNILARENNMLETIINNLKQPNN